MTLIQSLTAKDAEGAKEKQVKHQEARTVPISVVGVISGKVWLLPSQPIGFLKHGCQLVHICAGSVGYQVETKATLGPMFHSE